MKHRAVLLQALIALYYPFLFLICGVLALALVAIVWLLIAVRWMPMVVPMLLMIGALILGALVHMVLGMRGLWSRPAVPNEEHSIKLSRKKCPELFGLVDRVAEERQLTGPDRIRIASDTIAHVFEDDEQKRVLVLGALAVSNFSQAALEGILAHELAHFSAGDTRALRRSMARHAVMVYVETGLRTRGMLRLNPIVWLVHGYHALYSLVWASVARDQEFAADRKSVEQAGKEVTAAALIHIHVSERLPWVRLSSIAEATVQNNRTIKQLFTEHAARAKAIDEFEWQQACQKELEQPTGLFQHHPCLKERLAAIGVSPKKALKLALANSGDPVSGLIPDWAAIEQELTNRLIAVFAEQWQAKLEMRQIIVGRPFRA